MKRLILVGGGHAHVEVLRQFALQPDDAAEILLVSPYQHAAYSGMLPGWIAGHYQASDCQVALAPLARRARARTIWDRVIGINRDAGLLFCADGMPLHFDWLSIDIGSRPPTWDTPGADAHALPIKPIEAFMQRWEQIFQDAVAGRALQCIVVVGSGAAGLEVATAMQQRLASVGCKPKFIVIGATGILPGHNVSVQRRYARLLEQRGIEVLSGKAVAKVGVDYLQLADHRVIASNLTVWAAGAGAPLWPRACGLATDAQGFIRVNDSLQAVSARNIFAAGDVATVEPDARPKSGAYAVRAGPLLASNIRHALNGRSLERSPPAAPALALISAGAHYAVASRGNLALGGRWVWQWKDWIDRRWLRKYSSE